MKSLRRFAPEEYPAALERAVTALNGMLDAWHDYVQCDKQICLRFVPDGDAVTPHRTCDNTGSDPCELCAARAVLQDALTELGGRSRPPPMPLCERCGMQVGPSDHFCRE